MKMFFYALLALATVVAALPSGSAENRTASPQERGDYQFGDILWGAMTEFSRVNNPYSDSYVSYDYFTPCQIYFPKGYNYNLTAPLPGGLRGLACWSRGRNPVTWDDQTALTAACLAYLRVLQGHTCISTEGSVCDMGYLESGGLLKNLRQTKEGKSHADGNKITWEEYVALKAAINILIGLEVNDIEDSPYFIVVQNDGQTRVDRDKFGIGSRTDFQANFLRGKSC